MRILFVAMPFSIHTARWISQLNTDEFDIHFFSSMVGHDLHESIRGVTFHENFYDRVSNEKSGNRYSSIALKQLSFVKTPVVKKIIRKTLSSSGLLKSRAESLRQVIDSVKPDIIHTLETQHAGYLVKEVQKNFEGRFPLWIHSNWGIDLHFFGRLEKHIPILKETLPSIDVFLTEGTRDEKLARQFGFTGPVYTFPSVGGGFQIPPKAELKASARKKILVKGTQDLVRRGLVSLRSLERCIDLLGDYEIVLYSSNETTQAAAELFYHNTGKRITILKSVSQQEMLQLNAEALMNICVNMSDGVPNAMLESMLMGAFPIQSDTSLADEWLHHGKTGMIVPPEDPDIVEQAIRVTLTDDRMVDDAMEINRNLIAGKLEYDDTRNRVLEMYRGAYCSIGARSGSNN